MLNILCTLPQSKTITLSGCLKKIRCLERCCFNCYNWWIYDGSKMLTDIVWRSIHWRSRFLNNVKCSSINVYFWPCCKQGFNVLFQILFQVSDLLKQQIIFRKLFISSFKTSCKKPLRTAIIVTTTMYPVDWYPIHCRSLASEEDVCKLVQGFASKYCALDTSIRTFERTFKHCVTHFYFNR